MTERYLNLIEGLTDKLKQKDRPNALQDNIKALGTICGQISALCSNDADTDFYDTARSLIRGANGLLALVARDIERIEARIAAGSLYRDAPGEDL